MYLKGKKKVDWFFHAFCCLIMFHLIYGTVMLIVAFIVDLCYNISI